MLTDSSETTAGPEAGDGRGYLLRSEVSRIAGLSPEELASLIRGGQVRARQLPGRRMRVHLADVMAALARVTTGVGTGGHAAR